MNPWAEVFVDGRRIGLTPMRPIPLSAGKHSVLLKNDELKRSRRLSVVVPSGKQATVKENLFER